MKTRRQFNQHFSEENLKRIFTEYIVFSGAKGIDNLDQYAFRKQLNEQIEILSRKILAGNYKFSKYKLKLISKGSGKIPREISIPTVRDRIAMRAICDFLNEKFLGSLFIELPQNIIKKAKEDISSGQYTGFIKLDVSNFYPSIKHNELKNRLRKRIRESDILEIIFSAVTAPTVSKSKKTDLKSERGVPQGLAISNILANIYMLNIDRYMNRYPEISYYRFVDDVLIFCDIIQAKNITKDLITRFKKIGLKIHDPLKVPEKSSIASIENNFEYLGYSFKNEQITARKSTVEKLRNSLVGIFTSYKHSKLK